MPLRRAGKNMRAPLLGLAKYIYFTPKVLGSKKRFPIAISICNVSNFYSPILWRPEEV